MADCLSRAQVGSVHLGVDYAAVAADQLLDSNIQAFRSAVPGLWLEDVVFQDSGATLLCDVSTGQVRPMVTGWRRRVFEAMHALSHPGVRASVKLVALKFVWPGLWTDVRQLPGRQRAKVQRHTKAPLDAPQVGPTFATLQLS